MCLPAKPGPYYPRTPLPPEKAEVAGLGEVAGRMAVYLLTAILKNQCPSTFTRDMNYIERKSNTFVKRDLLQRQKKPITGMNYIQYSSQSVLHPKVLRILCLADSLSLHLVVGLCTQNEQNSLY